MFDLIKSSRVIVGIILAIIAIPFAFFGIDYYFRGDSAAGQVAHVAGSPIGQREFGEALRQQQEAARRRMQGKIDPAILDSPEFKQQVLDNLIDEHVLYAAALKQGLTVTPAELQARIVENPAFQDPSTGKFSRDAYDSWLRARGTNGLIYEAAIRKDLLLARMGQSIAATSFLPGTVADRLYRLRKQQREIGQVVLAPAQYIAQAKLDAGAAQAYYDAHKDEFKLPEKAKLEFVVLSADAMVKHVEVSEDEIKKLFEETAAKNQEPEERKASHILISAPASATAEAKKAAKAKAEELLTQARKNPKAFAQLAKNNSQDPGSAAEGGDLGYFPRGRMVKAFDDAVFGMKPGEIVGPIETQYGYHIIRLDAIRAAAAPDYAKLKPKLEDEVRKNKSAQRFAEAAELFSRTVHDEPDSLQAAIDALARAPYNLKLEPQKTGWFTAAGGDHPLLNNEKFLRSVFTEDVLKKKFNSEAVEIAQGMLVSARVIEYEPVKPRAFAEVQGQIVAKLTNDKAVELAKQDGEAKLARLRKGEPVALSWSAAVMVSRENRQGLSPAVAQEVFSADTGKLPTYVGAENPDGRYVLLRVSKVVEESNVEPSARKALATQIDQVLGRQEFEAQLASLKDKANVQINRKAIEKGS